MVYTPILGNLILCLFVFLLLWRLHLKLETQMMENMDQV